MTTDPSFRHAVGGDAVAIAEQIGDRLRRTEKLLPAVG
jgi:hypothetical protein